MPASDRQLLRPAQSDLHRAAMAACVTFLLLGAPRAPAAEAPASPEAPRPAWTTSRLRGTPEPPLPYVAERVFPGLQFTNCLDLVALPGSERLCVVEQGGKIFSFANRPEVKSADLMIDLARQIPGVRETYALAFHPNFLQNRYCYVCYILAPELPEGTHVARFRVTATDPPRIERSSETTIITWLSGGHNGCCLKFGPDGYLYISTGDGTGPNPPDVRRTGQDLSDLLSSILRIDVDHAEAGRNYRIPPDNPFVGRAGARGEVWAYGLRNPWRMSFDRRSGDLWVGDVGWEMWELLHRVERGGNYGWAVTEGRQPANPEWPRGPTPILPPTIDHSHAESSSITDGLTYYGSRLGELRGLHVYSDYDTGKFWGFRYQNGRVAEQRELADTSLRVVGFGEDHAGEFYVLDHVAGTIHRLIRNPTPNRSAEFPRRLSDTGLFAALRPLQPAPGVVPYSLQAEPWADRALAERWVAVPGEQSINTAGSPWKFPQDSVLVKTLSLELNAGRPDSRRRVETQVLHFDGAEWHGYSYRWNDQQTDADLVDAAGADQTFDEVDPDAPGGRRRRTWHFSSRGECQRCHNLWSGPPLAFSAPNLNVPTGAGDLSQLDRLARQRVLDRAIPADQRSRLANPRDPAASLDERARAYLHVNCAHCHRMHAGGSVLAFMHFDLPLEQTALIDRVPTQGTFQLPGARVIAPGDPFRSVLLYRVAKLGGGRMPHIGSSEVDCDGVALLARWIAQLPPSSSGEAGSQGWAKRSAEEAAELARLRAAESDDARSAAIDRLLSTTSGALRLLRAVDQRELAAAVAAAAVQRGAQHADPSVRDLFERFLPAERRVQRLGSVVRPEQILTLAGDAARGRRLFFDTAGVACKNCHRIAGQGQEVGPDLSAIGKKYSRAQLLESILEPSKRIDPQFVGYLAETDEGRIVSGLLVSKDAQVVVLKDAQGKTERLPAASVVRLVPQSQSLMPELLLRDLTAQQVADLLAFLTVTGSP